MGLSVLVGSSGLGKSLVFVAFVLALVECEFGQTYTIIRGEGLEEVGLVIVQGGGVVAVEVCDA